MKIAGIFLGIIAVHSLAFAAESVSKLEGHWSQYCQNGAQSEEFFQGNKVSLLEKNFSDVNCTNLDVVTESTGTFEADSEFRFPDQSTFDIDFTFANVKITLYSDRYVIFFSDREMCGIKDWKKGEAREITGLACEFFPVGNPVHVPQKGDMRYGIYKIDGSRLYFGRLMPGFDGRSPQRRPYLLDSRYFVKLAQAPLL